MNVDKGILKVSIKALNNCGLAKFQVDSKQAVETLISDFMSAVETVPVEKENDLPDAVADLYNLLSDKKTMEGGFDIADAALAARQKKEEIDMGKEKKVVAKPTEKKPVKKEKPAKPAKPAKETKPVPEKKVVVKTEKVGNETNCVLAVDYIRKNPGGTMADLKVQDWNTKGITYYNLFNKLIKAGTMKKEGNGYLVV